MIFGKDRSFLPIDGCAVITADLDVRVEPNQGMPTSTNRWPHDARRFSLPVAEAPRTLALDSRVREHAELHQRQRSR
jgi:hypothetical protein